MIQCSFGYTMQRSQNKIVRFFLNAPPRFHVGANEFKTVGLLPVEYRVQQLKLGYMFNIINLKAPEYLRTNVEMVHHIDTTQEPATRYVSFQE